MAKYDPKSLHAEEFINDEEIRETLAYAEANKNNYELIDQILEKARPRKTGNGCTCAGLTHREASVLLACDDPKVIERIYANGNLLAEVVAERAKARDMLLARGRAFEKAAAECGLETVPFSAGFFVMVPCGEPDLLCDKLAEKNVFLIPFDKGVRVSVAAISEDKCHRLPAIIKSAIEKQGIK